MANQSTLILNDQGSSRETLKPIKIAIVNVLNRNKDYAMNKDLNGGFGTADDYGNSFTSRIIKFLKKKSIRLPIISLAFLQALLKENGFNVKYFEGKLPKPGEDFDIIFVYGTVVDYKNENWTCRVLKDRFPKARVGLFGPFPSRNPEVFNSGDFVLLGEIEAFFMKDFKSIDQLKGPVIVSELTDMDKLPSPDFEGFPINEYSYSPAISEKPFVALQASKGCPYSCRYYCTYGEYQGPKIRQRSPKKVVDDILCLQKKYGIKGVQFRDPTFGLIKGFIDDFCNELKTRNVKIKWGMETRLDLLNEDNLKKMFDVGLRNVNVGIETNNEEIAKLNKRGLVEQSHQEKIIRFCEKLGIKVSAFYILGYEGETIESARSTIKYAMKLNTPLARFSISTPYPGTGFYEQLKKENRILTNDFEKYTQFNLVYKHDNLTQEQVKSLLEEALRKYYFRPSYFFKFLKWKIREFWL